MDCPQMRATLEESRQNPDKLRQCLSMMIDAIQELNSRGERPHGEEDSKIMSQLETKMRSLDKGDPRDVERQKALMEAMANAEKNLQPPGDGGADLGAPDAGVSVPVEGAQPK